MTAKRKLWNFLEREIKRLVAKDFQRKNVSNQENLGQCNKEIFNFKGTSMGQGQHPKTK